MKYGAWLLWWFGQQHRGTLLVLLLPFMTELLQGSTRTGWVLRCITWSRRYLRTTTHFSKNIMVPFTWQELFSHSLKSRKVNFNIFSGQHSHHVWTSLKHCGQLGRPEWGTDSHLQYL
jgi:hypothetical protein